MGCGASDLVLEEGQEEGHREERGAEAPALPEAVAAAECALLAAWGGQWTTTGFTDGHHISKEDHSVAEASSASLLYGEVLPAGMVKLMDSQHLDVASASRLIDLGSGCGRVAMLAWLAYPNLKHVLAVELSPTRHALAARAARKLAELAPEHFRLEVATSTRTRLVDVTGADHGKGAPRAGQPATAPLSGKAARRGERVLDLSCGDMWATAPHQLAAADIVLMHTEFTTAAAGPFKQTLAHMRQGARFVTYNDPSFWFEDPSGRVRAPSTPFVQLPANEPESDTFAVSWSATRGHHLYTWRREGDFAFHNPRFPPAADGAPGEAESKRGEA